MSRPDAVRQGSSAKPTISAGGANNTRPTRRVPSYKLSPSERKLQPESVEQRIGRSFCRTRPLKLKPSIVNYRSSLLVFFCVSDALLNSLALSARGSRGSAQR